MIRLPISGMQFGGNDLTPDKAPTCARIIEDTTPDVGQANTLYASASEYININIFQGLNNGVLRIKKYAFHVKRYAFSESNIKAAKVNHN